MWRGLNNTSNRRQVPTQAVRNDFRLSPSQQTLIEVMAYQTLPRNIERDFNEYERALFATVGFASAGIPTRQADRLVAGLSINSRLNVVARDFVGTMIQVTGIEETANGRSFKGVRRDTRANRIYDYNGRTYQRYIGDIRDGNRANLRRFSREATQAVKAPGVQGRTLVTNEMTRYRRRMTTILRDIGTTIRQAGYAIRDRALGPRDIDYWQSVAVLDSSTSPVCLRYHNRRYARGPRYRTRADIPYLPPRHPRCRSTIVTHYVGDPEPNEPTLESVFFSSNAGRASADALFGVEKARLIRNNLDKLNIKTVLVGTNTDVNFITNDKLIRLINARN